MNCAGHTEGGPTESERGSEKERDGLGGARVHLDVGCRELMVSRIEVYGYARGVDGERWSVNEHRLRPRMSRLMHPSYNASLVIPLYLGGRKTSSEFARAVGEPTTGRRGRPNPDEVQAPRGYAKATFRACFDHYYSLLGLRLCSPSLCTLYRYSTFLHMLPLLIVNKSQGWSKSEPLSSNMHTTRVRLVARYRF